MVSAISRFGHSDRKEGPAGKIRILEVVGRLGVGGLEAFILAFIRRRHPEFSVDVAACSTVSPYKEELRVAGVGFFVCGRVSRPFWMFRAFWRLLRTQPPYDIVHSHVRGLNGVFLTIAAIQKVPVRISHSYTNMPGKDSRWTLRARVKVLVDRVLHNRFVTERVACSISASAELFGDDFPVKVLHCGIDLDALNPATSRDSIRRELGIERTAFVVGHVGRFTKEKNHVFFEKIARILHARSGDTHFVLVGDEAIAGLFDPVTYRDTVHVSGVKTNVVDYLQTMDVFLFPSLTEGLPMALLEAQAMGLPCVYSDAITEEAEVCKRLMCRMPLDAAPERWADAVELMGRKTPRLDPENARALFRGSSFDIVENVRSLEALYRELCGASRRTQRG
jgi:glycosyltransferase involved in cell wall biosynthesis